MSHDLILSHQQQPCNKSCVSTCLAMLLNVPAKIMIDRHHEEYRVKGVGLDTILERYGFTPFYPKVIRLNPLSGLSYDAIILVTVPSLNNLGGTHQIIAQFWVEEFKWSILDPQRGTGAKFYTHDPSEVNDVDCFLLSSWMADAVIPIQQVLNARENFNSFAVSA
jgi:hypothetical protein